MIITKLQAWDFMGYVHLDIDLNPGCNLFIGGSDNGKSALIAMMRYGGTGTCEHSPSGRGADSLIRLTAKRAKVILTVMDPKTGEVFAIERSIPSQDGIGKTQETFNRIVADGLTISTTDVETFFAACLSTGQEAFIYRTRDDQKGILSTILGRHITTEAMEVGLRAFAGPLEAPLMAYYEAHRLPMQGSGDPFKWVEIELRDRKREIDTTNKQIAGYQSGQSVPFDVDAYATAQQTLLDLQAQEAQLRVAAEGEKRLHEQKVAAYQQAVLVYQAGQQRADKAVQRARVLQQAVEKDMAEKSAAETTLKKLPTDAAIRKEREALQIRHDTAVAETRAIIAQMSGKEACQPGECARAMAAVWSANLGVAQKAAGEARDAIVKLDSVTTNRRSWEEQIGRLKGSIERNQEELRTLDTAGPQEYPQDPGPPPNAVSVAQDLATRILAAKGVLQHLDAAKGLSAQAEANRRTIKSLQEVVVVMEREREILEVLKKALGPSGVKARLVETALKGFEAQVNAVCRAWGAPPIRWAVETPDWTLMARLEGGEIPARQTAKSCRVRIGGAIQVCLARETGLGMVAIDELESCDALARSAVRDWLADAADLQSMLITVSQQTEPWPDDAPDDYEPRLLRPQIQEEPRLAAFWVEGGHVEKVSIPV